MDENTYQRYRTWMWRRIFKRVGIPVSLLTVFILGRCSVTIPEPCPEPVVCPDPIVCPATVPCETDDDENGEDNPDQTDDSDLEDSDETETPPASQWDQP